MSLIYKFKPSNHANKWFWFAKKMPDENLKILYNTQSLSFSAKSVIIIFVLFRRQKKRLSLLIFPRKRPFFVGNNQITRSWIDSILRFSIFLMTWFVWPCNLNKTKQKLLLAVRPCCILFFKTKRSNQIRIWSDSGQFYWSKIRNLAGFGRISVLLMIFSDSKGKLKSNFDEFCLKNSSHRPFR